MNNNHFSIRMTIFLRIDDFDAVNGIKIDIINPLVLIFQDSKTAIIVAEESGNADVSSFIKEYIKVRIFSYYDRS